MPMLQEQPALHQVPAEQGRLPVSERRLRPQKVVVVHAGRRDGYQLAMAFAEADLLQALVTDFFWSDTGRWSGALRRFLPAQVMSLLRKRSAPALPQSKVRTSLRAGLGGLVLDKVRFLPFSLRQRLTRSADAALGKSAGTLARRRGAALVSYSYYGYDAFEAYGRGGVLFQMHPHPVTMRRILREELAMHPDCASSLRQEWELALPERDFERLTRETAMASQYIVASSFTRASLRENGVPEHRITVVPYGVDLASFRPDPNKKMTRTPTLRLLFVGRINQRKGLKYLLEALRLLQGHDVSLTICGRVVDDLALFAPFVSQIEIRPSVSDEELLLAYQQADLFVFPSVGEGFGQVLLEALACGLPILSTTHTAAPDLIEDGAQGFLIEPRNLERIAERILWAITHRRELAEMGVRARKRAEYFTWDRFREKVVEAVLQAPGGPDGARPEAGRHA